MTPLQIALATLGGLLLLLFLLLLFGRAKLVVNYDGGLEILLFGIGRKKVILQSKKPTPKKEAKRTDLTGLTGTDRKLTRLFKKQKRALEKAKRKRAKEAARKAARQRKREEKKKKREAPPLSPIETLTLAAHLIKKIYKITKGKCRLRIKRLTIVVGSDDAASTALLYGSLSALLAELLDFIDANYIDTKIEKNAVSITPDFTADACKGEISFAISTSLLRAFGMLAKGGISYVRERAKIEQKASIRLKEQELNHPSASAE